MAAALATSASMSCPAAERIWIVTSRATSACHSLAAARTSMTAPVVSEARNVMIAITATRAWPEIVACGTIGVSKRGSSSAAAPGGPSRASDCWGVLASVVNMQSTLVQHQPARIELIHQRDIVGGDDHRRPGLVQLDEQAQQALRQRGIDVAGGLVGEQQLRTRDDGPRDRRALLLAAGQHGRQRPHALAEPDPFQELHHLLAIAVLRMADHAQRQCDVLVGGHVVEQPEILKHDADAAA